MSDLNEPEDGSYVAVRVRSGVQVMHRDDVVANHPSRRWMTITAQGLVQKWAMSWTEVCALGPVAYVGAFVDRRTT